MRYEPGLSVWLFGGLWCLLFGFVGLGLVLFLARIFSVTLFNSIKVTCASRHTQRLRSCKKTGHAATSGHTASGHGHAHPATATDTATRPRPRPHGHPAMAIRPRPRPRGKKIHPRDYGTLELHRFEVTLRQQPACDLSTGSTMQMMTPHGWTRRQGQPSKPIAALSNGYPVLTTHNSAIALQNYFQNNSKKATVETAVKVAGATARRCIVLLGKQISY